MASPPYFLLQVNNQLQRRLQVTRQSDKPEIFAKFINKDILGEMGRLLFTLLNTFASNGYRINLFHNLDFAELEKENRPYIRLVESIDNLAMVMEIPERSKEMIYLFDKKERACATKSWNREIHVKFDIFSNYLYSTFKKTNPLFFPYPMHPLNYGADLQMRLANAKRNEKKFRIFFSGDTEGYKRNRIHYPTKKLTRTEIIDAILERLGDRVYSIPDSPTLGDVLEKEYFRGFVLVDNRKFRIEATSWLETLSRADFFLCPPGYVMPMCHNVIEAMAVGTIPIINYPEWMNPGLVDMVNCVAFEDREDLIRKLILVLDMEKERIVDIRARVIEYYRDYLDHAGFVKSFESVPGKEITLLMITDAHVANNESKLNKNSILITGKPMHPSGILKSSMNTLKFRPDKAN